MSYRTICCKCRRLSGVAKRRSRQSKSKKVEWGLSRDRGDQQERSEPLSGTVSAAGVFADAFPVQPLRGLESRASSASARHVYPRHGVADPPDERFSNPLGSRLQPPVTTSSARLDRLPFSRARLALCSSFLLACAVRRKCLPSSLPCCNGLAGTTNTPFASRTRHARSPRVDSFSPDMLRLQL